MSLSIEVQDAHGRRALGETDLPLAMAAAEDGILTLTPVPLAAGEALAYIGLAEEHLFVQAASSAAAVHLNAEPVTESRWIGDGDVLALGQWTVHCRSSDGHWRFLVQGLAPAPSLQPPDGPPPAKAGVPLPALEPATLARRPRRRSRALSLILLGLFAVLVMGAGFVFTAVPVSLEIEPAPETLDIAGTLPGVHLRGRRLMFPGHYQLSATRQGYHPLQAGIDVPWSGRHTFEFRMKKLPGLITLRTRPQAGARVAVDDRDLGATPVAPMELEAGPHLLVVEAERYLSERREIEVEGLGREQLVEIQLTPAWAPVMISSEPPGAMVLIADEEAGETPLSVELLQGAHALSVRKEGYRPGEAEIQVVANVPLEVPPFELQQALGVVQVTSTPSVATVSVDGAFRGTTPLALELEPGVSHRLRLSKPGYAAGTRSLTLQPGERTAVRVALAAGLGVIFVTATPADAQLSVDGQPVGRATRRLELSTVPHTLEISKAGYSPFKTTLTPRQGASQKLVVELESTTRAAASAVRTGAGQALRLVKGGRFQMGASRREQGRRSNESLRSVQLTRPFYIGVKEVSNEEFLRFKPSHTSGAMQGLPLNRATQPAAMVSWEDAARYLNWLSAKDSLPPAYEEVGTTLVPVSPLTTGYRLPTEAEWTFVARYGVKPPSPKYPWGNRFPPTSRDAGNYADATAASVLPNVIAGYSDGHAVSAPVGSFPANALGIFDLGGNVAEWCHDYYAVYPAAAKLERDPVGRSSGKHHVVRGSSWRHSSISELRLTYRDYSSKPRQDLGFRIARYAQ